MLEFRNLSARCIEPKRDAEYVMHEVDYEFRPKEGGAWRGMTNVRVLARDPMDAIQTVTNSGAL